LKKLLSLTHSGEIFDIARNEISTDVERSERDEHVEMNPDCAVEIETNVRSWCKPAAAQTRE
jgi:hypothetical protein